LPAVAAEWLEAKGLASSDKHHRVSMLRPVPYEDEMDFSKLLQSPELNSHTRASIRLCAENLRTLSSFRE
jgi:hypothetical protein